jgi:hypothetical protein
MKPIEFTEIELWLMYGIVCKQHLESMLYISKQKYNVIQLPSYATIYSIISPIRNKNAIVLLSGGAQLENIPFIRKTVDDIDAGNSHDIFIYENKKQLNFLCTDDIVNWIQMEIQPRYETLTFIAFSNGGVIASHVMYKLENTPNKPDFINKTLITIDSLVNMYDFLKIWGDNKIYRMDIIGCYMSAFIKSFDHFHLYHRINPMDMITNTNVSSGKKYFERMYGIDNKCFHMITTAEYRLRNCKIINIYSHYDPIIQRYYNEIQYEILIRNIELEIPDIRSKITNIGFETITHCTQMFDPKTSDEFANILRQHLCT